MPKAIVAIKPLNIHPSGRIVTGHDPLHLELSGNASFQLFFPDVLHYSIGTYDSQVYLQITCKVGSIVELSGNKL